MVKEENRDRSEQRLVTAGRAWEVPGSRSFGAV